MSQGKAQDLIDLKQALQNTIRTLTSPSKSTSALPTGPPSTTTLHTDLVSLLTLLKSHTTTLALALGKQPPTPHAALPYLTKTASDWLKVCWIVEQLDSASQLRKEWGWSRDEVQAALEGSLRGYTEQIFPREGASAPVGGKSGPDGYLGKVRAVYAAVDRAGGLSKTELESIIKRWMLDGEELKDGELELKEMVEIEDDSEGGKSGEDEDEEEDDDWGGLVDKSKENRGAQMTSQEEDRINQILPLLRFPSLIHSSLLKTHLVPSLPSSFLPSLIKLSKSLLQAQDTLVSSLYSPQTVAEVIKAVQALETACLSVSARVREELQGSEEEKVKKGRWLDVWETQVKRIGAELVGEKGKLIP